MGKPQQPVKEDSALNLIMKMRSILFLYPTQRVYSKNDRDTCAHRVTTIDIAISNSNFRYLQVENFSTQKAFIVGVNPRVESANRVGSPVIHLECDGTGPASD
ncbi:MAG: hypothetical protein H7839_22790, partial [Magnetococcus sp. YQC-5]